MNSMRIHQKFMVFFVVILCAMGAISWYLYSSGKTTSEQYDDILDRFLVLNEISQHTSEAARHFEQYLLLQSEPQLDALRESQEALEQSRTLFTEIMPAEHDASLYKNYYHMLAYFNHEMNAAVITQRSQETGMHLIHRDEAEKVASWLNDTTLQLINAELRDYHDMHAAALEARESQLTLALNGAGLLFLTSIIFTYIMSKRILRPVRKLIHQSSEISAGNFTVEDVPVTNDEVGVLSATFNQMKHNLQQLIGEMRERARLERVVKDNEIEQAQTLRLLKEMELKSLQNQMNPHFLFNTLNTTAKMAYVEGAGATSRLIVAISKLLRYNLKPIESKVTLAEELNHIQKYADIQRARFGERVSVEVDIRTSHLDLRLPVLTLQPLIENAFIHGLDPLEEGGSIYITAEDTVRGAAVTVRDTGVGMSAEALERVVYSGSGSTAPNGHLTGIGLVNVQKRLQLLFDEPDLVVIQSEEGKGTAITLHLPLETKGVITDEAPHAAGGR